MTAAQRPIDPTWTWGSSARLILGPAQGSSVSAQLAQISLPEPAVCCLYLQARARIVNPADIFVGAFTINLAQGLGRVTVPRQVTFANQPSATGPLEWTLPFVPLHALQVDVQATANFRNEAPPDSLIEIEIYFVLAPITRIPQHQQKLSFGMALPGEADDMDDELRQDLESEGPTAAAAIMEGRRQVDASDDHMEGDGEEPDDGDEPGPGRKQPPAWVYRVVEQLTKRHGRKPTMPELRAAVQRLQARQARRRKKAPR